MILWSKEIREWREVIDTTLLKRSEETIDNIVSKFPKAQRAWSQLSNDPFSFFIPRAIVSDWAFT